MSEDKGKRRDDLLGFQARISRERINRERRVEEWLANSDGRFADWTTVNGVEVLRIGNERFVAVPCTGRRNSRKFDILDIEAGEYKCQVPRKEAPGWLRSAGADD